MVSLAARPAWADGLPIETAAARLDGVDPGPVTALMAGPDLPGPGEVRPYGEGRILWWGRGRALVIGAEVPHGTPGRVDQTDGFGILHLSGPAARDVLARLVPLDLRDCAHADGHVAASLLGHIPLHLLRDGDAWDLLVPRSMTLSAVDELARAMRGVAARAAH